VADGSILEAVKREAGRPGLGIRIENWNWNSDWNWNWEFGSRTPGKLTRLVVGRPINPSGLLIRPSDDCRSNRLHDRI